MTSLEHTAGRAISILLFLLFAPISGVAGEIGDGGISSERSLITPISEQLALDRGENITRKKQVRIAQQSGPTNQPQPLISEAAQAPGLATKNKPSQVDTDEWVPPGFEDLDVPAETEIDVFYGGYYLVSVSASFTSDLVTILDVDTVIGRLDDLTNPAFVAELLGRPLYSNAEEICKSRNSVDCGKIRTDSVDIIFDLSRLKLDLFIAPDLLKTRTPEQLKYLPSSDVGFSVLDDMGLNFSANQGEKTVYNFFNTTLLSHAENRLMVKSNVVSDGKVNIDTMAFQREYRGRDYQLGVFRKNAGSMRFMKDLQFKGVAIESSLTTRRNLDFALGSELELFLDSRSRVEIYKDGRLVESEYYEIGNQVIDTSALPNGAYNIDIRIIDVANQVRDETRFYSKTSRLPPADQSLYFIQFGEVAATDKQSLLPESTGDNIFRAGYSRRLSSALGGALGASITDDSEMLELGIFSQGLSYEFQAQMAYDSYDSSALDLSLRYRFGFGDLRVSSRKIWGDDIPADEQSQLGPSLTQYNLSLSFRTGYGSGSVFSRLNKDSTGDAIESYGVRWSVGRLFDVRGLSAKAEMSRNDNESLILFGVNYFFQKERLSATINGRLQRETGLGQGSKVEPLGNMNVALTNDPASAELYRFSLNADYQDDATYEAKIDARTSRGEARLNSRYTQRDDNLNFSGNLKTNFGYSNGEVGFGGNMQTKAGYLIHIQGPRSELAEVDVLVDGRKMSSIGLNQTIFVPVSAHRTHQLSFATRGDSLIQIKAENTQKTFYPGNVVAINAKAEAIFVGLVQLVDSQDKPLANAIVQNQPGLAITDQYGFLQAEMLSGSEELILKRKGVRCRVDLKEYRVEDQIALLGKRVCQPISTRNQSQ